ncbi:MFS transporter [Nocardioidaceae bacterium]|nr:MFS transporter [Nocardioidaceae bacterium]
MLVLATVAFFATAPGQSFVVSVFVDDFLVGTGLSRTAFSGLYAAGTVVSALSMLALGRVVDRAGLRVAWCAVAAVLAVACGLASVASGAVLAFFALALLRSSGQGGMSLVGQLLVARSFTRRRGQAMAVANLGVTGASIALPPLVALLIVAIGYRSAYLLLGLVVLVAVVPLGLLVRTGPVAPGTDVAAPMPGTPHAPDTEVAAFPAATRTTRGRWPDLPSARATRMLLVLAAPPLIATALTFHAVSILGERGIGFIAAGVAVGLMGATAVVGVLGAGVVLDRISTRVTLALLSALELVGVLALLVPTEAAAYVSFAVLGVAAGGVGVANGTVWARTFGLAGLGRLQGRAQSSMITSAAVAPLVPALSLSQTGSYVASLVVLALVAAAALTLSLLPDAGARRAD